MIEILKRWWLVIVDTLLDWIDKRDNDRLSKIANLMAIFLMVIGFMNWIFKKKKRKKKSSIVEKVASTTKPPKYLTYLDDPTAKGEELGELAEEIYTGGKKNMSKFWKALKNAGIWLWGNKSQLADSVYVFIIGVVVNIAMWNNLIAQFLPTWLDVTWVKIVVTIVSLLMTILSWINTATSRKFDSLASITAAQKEKDEAKAKKSLNAEQLATVQSLYADYEHQKEVIESTIEDFEKQISKIKTAIEIGTSTQIVEQNNLSNLNSQIAQAKTKLAGVMANLEKTQAKIEELTK